MTKVYAKSDATTLKNNFGDEFTFTAEISTSYICYYRCNSVLCLDVEYVVAQVVDKREEPDEHRQDDKHKKCEEN